jgi:DNA-binding response OmpR family regulator
MKTILLVDDDQQVHEVFGLALRRSGYYVIEAHSLIRDFQGLNWPGSTFPT